MGNKHTVDAHTVNYYLDQLKNIDEEVYNKCKKLYCDTEVEAPLYLYMGRCMNQLDGKDKKKYK